MRYIVIEYYTDKIICNVAEEERAINICKCYPDTVVVNSDNVVVYSNVDIPFC